MALLHQAFPELIFSVLETVSIERVTKILRSLVKEEVSIRDLRAILERILTYDYILTDLGKYIVFDDRLAIHESLNFNPQDDVYNYVQHVRAGLKKYISHKYTYGRGNSSLIVYLLDPKTIEDRVIDTIAFEKGNKDKSPLTVAEFEKILAAIRTEISLRSRTSNLPVILTIAPIRSYMRKLVTPEFPSLSVLSYDELSSDTNIQPIARISLE